MSVCAYRINEKGFSPFHNNRMIGVAIVFVLTSLFGGRRTGSARGETVGLSIAVRRVQNVHEYLNMTSLWGEEYDY
jgi:hypothetical protein